MDSRVKAPSKKRNCLNNKLMKIKSSPKILEFDKKGNDKKSFGNFVFYPYIDLNF